jgi:hypothetical protein
VSQFQTFHEQGSTLPPKSQAGSFAALREFQRLARLWAGVKLAQVGLPGQKPVVREGIGTGGLD